jgi:hypothetical protein
MINALCLKTQPRKCLWQRHPGKPCSQLAIQDSFPTLQLDKINLIKPIHGNNLPVPLHQPPKVTEKLSPEKNHSH